MRRSSAFCLLLVAAAAPAQDVVPASGIRPRTASPNSCQPCPPAWLPQYPSTQPAQPPQPGQPQPPAPAQPNLNQPPTTPLTDGGRGAALASGEGALPNVIGDLLNPDELLPFPVVPGAAGPSAQLLAARAQKSPPQTPGFKVGENENVRPLDRVYVSFNYFTDVNGRLNRFLGAEVGRLDAQRYTFGVEKTLFGGDASVGLRVPVNTLYVRGTPFPLLNGTFTSVGDLAMIAKTTLWHNRQSGRFGSLGLLVIAPTGQESFGGGGFLRSARDVKLQPFLGYILPEDRLYLQGFFSVSFPTDWGRDVVMMFNDLSVGYRLYTDPTGQRLLSAFTPIFEMHVNTPLNHRGSLNGPLGTPDTVVLTQGANFEFRRRALLTVGLAEPVTGFRPFTLEAMMQLNWRY